MRLQSYYGVVLLYTDRYTVCGCATRVLVLVRSVIESRVSAAVLLCCVIESCVSAVLLCDTCACTDRYMLYRWMPFLAYALARSALVVS